MKSINLLIFFVTKYILKWTLFLIYIFLFFLYLFIIFLMKSINLLVFCLFVYLSSCVRVWSASKKKNEHRPAPACPASPCVIKRISPPSPPLRMHASFISESIIIYWSVLYADLRLLTPYYRCCFWYIFDNLTRNDYCSVLQSAWLTCTLYPSSIVLPSLYFFFLLPTIISWG